MIRVVEAKKVTEDRIAPEVFIRSGRTKLTPAMITLFKETLENRWNAGGTNVDRRDFEALLSSFDYDKAGDSLVIASRQPRGRDLIHQVAEKLGLESDESFLESRRDGRRVADLLAQVKKEIQNFSEGFAPSILPPLYAAQLEKIAKDTLHVETLHTRNSDSLDFYDVSVWGVKSALTQAFVLGAKSYLAGVSK